MDTDSQALEWLQSFFQASCNGDWEHDGGCKIESMSDPGWRITFHLAGTIYEDRTLDELHEENGPLWWLKCSITDARFVATCSPRRLGECIEILRDVVEGRRGGRETPAEE